MVNFQSDAMSMVHFSTAMRYRVFLEKLDIAIVAIIFLDLQERLCFDYFAHFRTDYFGITRSYAALRAADLDWIVGPGYSLGRSPNLKGQL